MNQCAGNEVHEHFSLITGTFIEHQHEHDKSDKNFNTLHHHAPVDHHIFTEDELAHNERDTGRRLTANAE